MAQPDVQLSEAVNFVRGVKLCGPTPIGLNSVKLQEWQPICGTRLQICTWVHTSPLLKQAVRWIGWLTTTYGLPLYAFDSKIFICQRKVAFYFSSFSLIIAAFGGLVRENLDLLLFRFRSHVGCFSSEWPKRRRISSVKKGSPVSNVYYTFPKF